MIRCLLLTVVSAILIRDVQAVEPKFSLGKETTYVEGPLDADGFVDYAGALNAHYGRDVKPEENANVLIWEAFGPGPLDESIRERYFALLGVPVPPQDGKYFTLQRTFLKLESDARSPWNSTTIDNQFRKARRRPWRADEFPELAAWLAVNEGPLKIIEAASRREKFYHPTVLRVLDGRREWVIYGCVNALDVWQEAGQASVARCTLRLGEGRFDDARRDLFTCLRFGSLVLQNPGSFGYSARGNASGVVTAYLQYADPSLETLRACANEFDRLPPLPDVAERIELAGRFTYLDMLQLMKMHGFDAFEAPAKQTSLHQIANGMVMLCDFEGAMRNGNRYFDRLAAAEREPDVKTRQKKLKSLESEIESMSPKYFRNHVWFGFRYVVGSPRLRGDAVGEQMLPAAVLAVTGPADVAQDAAHVRVLFALASYRREHGRYPETLDALVPKYLAVVPQDADDGEPLAYRRTKAGFQLPDSGGNVWFQIPIADKSDNGEATR